METLDFNSMLKGTFVAGVSPKLKKQVYAESNTSRILTDMLVKVTNNITLEEMTLASKNATKNSNCRLLSYQRQKFPSERDLEKGCTIQGNLEYSSKLETTLTEKLSTLPSRFEPVISEAFGRRIPKIGTAFSMQALFKVFKETAGIENMFKPLIINSGFMEKALNPEWISDVHFAINQIHVEKIPPYTRVFRIWLNVLYMYHAELVITYTNLDALLKCYQDDITKALIEEGYGFRGTRIERVADICQSVNQDCEKTND